MNTTPKYNTVRLPVLREDGSLAALPWGYDREAKVMTLPPEILGQHLAALEMGAQFDADGVEAGEAFRQKCQEHSGDGAFVRNELPIHVVLPLGIGGEIHWKAFGLDENPLVEVCGYLERREGAGNAIAIGHGQN